MTKKIDLGGPAFPVHPDMAAQLGCIPSSTDAGMSVRDYFAAKTIPFACSHLKGVFESDGENDFDLCRDDELDELSVDAVMVAEMAYGMADAMMMVRARNGNKTA